MADVRARSGASVTALVGVLLVAANLRPAVTSLGPVLPFIASDTGLGATAMGVLGAVPITMFAVVSPMVHVLVERYGLDRTTTGALALLAVGTLVRSWPSATVSLWLGMAIVGATIAVLNVVLPAIVKRDFPLSPARVTGLYVGCLSVFAALSSGLAVPLAAATDLSWRLSLGAWVVLTFAALAVWLPRALREAAGGTERGVGPGGRPATGEGPAPTQVSVWRTRLAWQLAAYMGTQSAAYYLAITWLPTIEQDLGVAPAAAGWHLFALQLSALCGNLVAPVLMRLTADERLAAIVPGLLIVVGAGGLLAAPGLVVVWVCVLGAGTGAAFVVSLSLMGIRASDPATAARLSAMAQAVGYTLAGTSLVVAGVLRDLSGGGTAVLVLLAALGACVVVLALPVGRPRNMATPSGPRSS